MLREHPTGLLRLDEAGTHVERELDRDVTGDPSWYDVARDDLNSLGEGLAFGPSGEVVLAKEKRLARCSSGGPRGHRGAPAALAAHRARRASVTLLAVDEQSMTWMGVPFVCAERTPA